MSTETPTAPTPTPNAQVLRPSTASDGSASTPPRRTRRRVGRLRPGPDRCGHRDQDGPRGLSRRLPSASSSMPMPSTPATERVPACIIDEDVLVVDRAHRPRKRSWHGCAAGGRAIPPPHGPPSCIDETGVFRVQSPDGAGGWTDLPTEGPLDLSASVPTAGRAGDGRPLGPDGGGGEDSARAGASLPANLPRPGWADSS